MKKHPLFGIGLATAGALIIAPDTMFMRWSDMTGFQMAAWRGLLSGIGFILIWLITRKASLLNDLRILKTKWSIFIVVSQVFTATLFSVGVSIAPASILLIGVATVPVFSAIFAHLILGEVTLKSTWITIFAVLLGISIAVFGASQNEFDFGIWPLLGALCGLGAALFLALNFVIIRHKTELPFVLSIGIGALISGLIGLFLTGHSLMGVGNIWPIIFTGTIILPISFYMLSLASRYTHVTNVSLIMLLETVLGPLWVWLGTGEQPTNLTIFGGFIVILCLGVYLTTYKQQK
ncbi:MAG: drug/metabolite transporter (DMT)-like permease [Paracoccaceae bacterium]|jgi:drug/metabolite transporter (DMT)-like permease